MIKDFLQILCNLYIVALAAFLPLYSRGTYVLLGDDKYRLFRSVSLLSLGLALAAALGSGLVDIVRTAGSQRDRTKPLQVYQNLSAVDIGVLSYGIAVTVSALCSSYGATAWTGYREWYMGAVSQLFFVGIYFFVSRCYQGDSCPVYLWEAAFFLVAVLGLCNRLGFDPLKLMQGFNSGDWEYSHLISTIGNINWFCGYSAVALAMPVTGYLKGRHPGKTLALYVVSVLGLLLLCIQGSDVGPVLAAVCLGVCFVWSREDEKIFGRTLLLTAGVTLSLPCYGIFARLRGEAAFRALPSDGLGLSYFAWNGWWAVSFICLGLFLILRRLPDMNFMWKRGSRESVMRGPWLGMMIVAAAAAVVCGGLYLSRMHSIQAWMEGRGALWRLSLQSFWRGDLKQKLLGAGPDCFAEYIYSAFAPSELVAPSGYWAGTVFTNAHNQWLNHLVNIGLLGASCAVFVAAASVRRYRRYLPGVLVLAMYGVNSLVSFQQVLSTPLFFLMLGICEYSVRKQHSRYRS